MERGSREWLVPLLGVLFLVLLFASFIIQGDPKDASHPANEVQQWYVDNKDSAMLGAFIGVVAASVLVFYGAYLRSVLSVGQREGMGAMLPTIVLIGTAIIAIAGSIDNMLIFAGADRADDISATSVQAIQAIYDDDFGPFILGTIVFNWSVGLSVLRTGVLPKWMGWGAILFGVLSLAGPISFVGLAGAGLFVLISSIMLSVRARSGAAPATV